MDDSALRGLTVVELGGGVAASYCGRLLGAFGATVIKIEKAPDGDDARRIGPFVSDNDDPETSALFLYLSALDDSHKISQDIASTTGSFLHGIMHRQEPDYPNSKYWFRRVGDHELFPQLREATLHLLNEQNEAASKQLRDDVERRPAWDPHWFIDQCESAMGSKDASLVTAVERIQLLEWQLVFDYSYRSAVG